MDPGPLADDLTDLVWWKPDQSVEQQLDLVDRQAQRGVLMRDVLDFVWVHGLEVLVKLMCQGLRGELVIRLQVFLHFTILFFHRADQLLLSQSDRG